MRWVEKLNKLYMGAKKQTCGSQMSYAGKGSDLEGMLRYPGCIGRGR